METDGYLSIKYIVLVWWKEIFPVEEISYDIWGQSKMKVGQDFSQFRAPLFWISLDVTQFPVFLLNWKLICCAEFSK